ncbi:putative nicotinate phosphoribosyltransferase [Tritonibacter multivorans]|uniref:Nicotinamide phosphoribosyltransferase n=1 Tax=Tritonibacter multivorans TaxID=928856 RepID=A0A0N7LZV2_9RHOB|nr:nicotinate phosphoribosyltransferase [Tritonibacter multivorans]MDA7421996.1 nicotinate phosphoribosyltransferase [Tritonibacter multivorans]CUH78697.1 putative nicotinate phosphoribosyltransferase [Tritonibacter multivorans]SFD65888.1 nicotinamide phosphoribosyltransferase [Tritonibacter multivorans]
MMLHTSNFAEAIDAGNFLLDTDSYKYSHPQQFPKGTERVFAYIEPRRADGVIDELVFFGLQAELMQLSGQVITQAMLDEAAPFIQAHGLSLYTEMFQHIIDAHDGRLPVQIDALPEGTIAPVSVPQVRIVNTDPKCWALPGFLETRLLRAVWYPSTVATLSNYVMRQIRSRLMETDGSDDGLAFKLHDFGARGATSAQSAALGGAAHLVNSMGTDTMGALVLARNVYGAEMAGFSIPATEHSTVTSFGPTGELAFMRQFLADNPNGIIACVSDSYDLMRAVREYWGTELRDAVLARDGVLVVRPDSGDPVDIVPAVIEALMEKFGYSETPKGFRILPDQLRVIQGDGVNKTSIVEIMDRMIERGLAIGNIAFGMGAGLLQKLDRDTFSYSMKTSAICVRGIWRDVFKDPVTAQGSKTSKKGRLGVMETDSGRFVVRPQDNIPPGHDALKPVFVDGALTLRHSFADIRKRVGLIR